MSKPITEIGPALGAAAPTRVEAASDAVLSLTSGGRTSQVPLYSEEGLALVGALWTKLIAEYRLNYRPAWLGVPIIQFPEDIVAMQELIWRLRPDLIIETGVAHGGSLVLYASLCELIGRGRVVGVDVEVRQYNRVAIEAHPLSHRIELIEGDSVAPTTVAEVGRRCAGAGRVLVSLDSSHSAAHVAAELEAYHRFVTLGSYLVVMDGAQALVHDIPRGQASWREDNPLAALEPFLAAHPGFRCDPHYTRFGVTSSPRGFLQRVAADSAAAPA